MSTTTVPSASAPNDLEANLRRDNLAAQIRAGHSDVRDQIKLTLVRAIEVGGKLHEARSLVHEGWMDWVQQNCSMSHQTANLYMRVWVYQEHLPEGTSFKDAKMIISGLPSVRVALPESDYCFIRS